jgi:SAM-dependent methyltransferase
LTTAALSFAAPYRDTLTVVGKPVPILGVDEGGDGDAAVVAHLDDLRGCGGLLFQQPLIAARMVGARGRVVAIDMTAEMLKKARAAAEDFGLENIEFRQAYIENVPVPDGWADVIISNGVINLAPNKGLVFEEMNRILKPGGRVQIDDIIVQKAVPDSAKRNIDLWAG